MPDMERLAEAQREAVRALAALTEQLRQTQETGTRDQGPVAREALGRTTEALSELERATTANTRALGEVGRRFGELPGLLGGLAGGLKDRSSGLGEVFKSGLGLAPLGARIAGLFRGRREEPAAAEPYYEPPSLALEVANTANILAGLPRVDRGQRGDLRVLEPPRTVVIEPQVTVNVSAMDSRSFLDHSGEITRAVRDAMLHMHPLNDLIQEL